MNIATNTKMEIRMRKIGIDQILIVLLVITIPMEPLFPSWLRWGVILCSAFYALLRKKVNVTSYMIFGCIFLVMLCISLTYTPKEANGADIILMYLKAFLQTSCAAALLIGWKRTNQEKFKFALDCYLVGTVAILIYTFFVEYKYIFSVSNWRLGQTVFENNGTFMMLSYSIIISLAWTVFNVIERKKYFVSFFGVLLAAVLSGTKKL